MPASVLGDMQKRLRMRMLKQGPATDEQNAGDAKVDYAYLFYVSAGLYHYCFLPWLLMSKCSVTNITSVSTMVGFADAHAQADKGKLPVSCPAEACRHQSCTGVCDDDSAGHHRRGKPPPPHPVAIFINCAVKSLYLTETRNFRAYCYLG